MLQDLDALGKRIQQIVQMTHELQSERKALLEKVRRLEQDCQALKDQQSRDMAEFTRMSDRLARHDQELQAVRDETDEERTALAAEARQHRTRSETLQTQLTETAADRDRLRQAASGAQQQIDLILERLPGAEA